MLSGASQSLASFFKCVASQKVWESLAYSDDKVVSSNPNDNGSKRIVSNVPSKLRDRAAGLELPRSTFVLPRIA